MEIDFDQLILPLGATLPAGRAAACAVYDALADMAYRGEAAVEETEARREADELTICFHADAMSACQENAGQVCAALAEVSALCARPHDTDTFWFEVSIPGVFPESDSAIKQSVSVEGEARPALVDEPLPEWLSKALKGVSEENGALRFEDFSPNQEQMMKLAVVYTDVKALAENTGAMFEFTKPEPPHNLHGGVHLKAHGLIYMEKENLAALLALIKTAGSFSVSTTDDGYVYFSFWVNNIYLAKE